MLFAAWILAYNDRSKSQPKSLFFQKIYHFTPTEQEEILSLNDVLQKVLKRTCHC